ncbi:thioredoxin [Corynebacterium poyangense]|uniref:Thioredoxin n=1 Tax=Corynebacterium poyangense TaxID=2684405 RepID=A0A7H0SS00_9CORY|nr:thioredoxin [Corynebacterium poyangense]MBZ8177271.1 thioredoxin [Corynebacterium poyangense]QNQ91325.1 thioredoxin [Corynebacterium poyangense]
MSTVHTFTQSNFRSQVIDSDRPVLVDFWAEWCGPCRKMNPVIEKIAEEMGDKVVVGKINLDQERALGAMYQIMSIPCLMVFKDGEKVEEMVGVKPASQIVAALEKHL